MQQAERATDRVTRAAAARALGVDRATITRICKAHPSLLDDAGRVIAAEIDQLRRATVNPALATRAKDAPASTLNATRERSETAKAAVMELDLAERLGLTLQVSDVQQQVMAAGQAFNQACAHLARDRAEALALITDTREMERAIEDLLNHLRDQLAQGLTLAAASTGPGKSS